MLNRLEQVCDLAEEVQAATGTRSGTGHLDFAGAFAALREIDYDGWHTLQCRLRGDPRAALPATARFLRQFEQ
jgi:sugar phosphate isomerase/epimerase